MTSSDGLERLFTLEEVARHLGISTRTVKRFIASRKLQVLRFGRVARITETELARFLREGTEPGKPSTSAPSKPSRAPPPLDRDAIFELALQTVTKKGGRRKRYR